MKCGFRVKHGMTGVIAEEELYSRARTFDYGQDDDGLGPHPPNRSRAGCKLRGPSIGVEGRHVGFLDGPVF